MKPVTCALAEGGDTAEVLLPGGGWYDWFTGEYFRGGQRIRIATPLDRFPVFVRAGGIVPAAEGAKCAADLPAPAREILVFGGEDGSFEIYDDEGDGYTEGITVPVRYTETDGTLTLGRMKGKLPEPVSIAIRLTRPDGQHVIREARYSGEEIRITF